MKTKKNKKKKRNKILQIVKKNFTNKCITKKKRRNKQTEQKIQSLTRLLITPSF